MQIPRWLHPLTWVGNHKSSDACIAALRVQGFLPRTYKAIFGFTSSFLFSANYVEVHAVAHSRIYRLATLSNLYATADAQHLCEHLCGPRQHTNHTNTCFGGCSYENYSYTGCYYLHRYIRGHYINDLSHKHIRGPHTTDFLSHKHIRYFLSHKRRRVCCCSCLSHSHIKVFLYCYDIYIFRNINQRSPDYN